MNFTLRWLKRSRKTRRGNQETQKKVEKDEHPSKNVVMDKAACDRKACRISKSSVKSDKNLIVDLEKENNIHVYNGKEMDIENILI